MMTKRKILAGVLALILSPTLGRAEPPLIAPPPAVQDDGTITTPSFRLPYSSLASPEAAKAFVDRVRHPMKISADLAQMRKSSDEALAPLLALTKRLYPFTGTKSKIAGVPVETIEPGGGVASAKRDRVLIELHGGGFVAGGGGPTGELDSAPIAALTGFNVVPAISQATLPSAKSSQSLSATDTWSFSGSPCGVSK